MASAKQMLVLLGNRQPTTPKKPAPQQAAGFLAIITFSESKRLRRQRRRGGVGAEIGFA